MFQTLVRRLHDERAGLWEQQKALLDAAEAQKRDLNGEEDAEWALRNTRIDEIDERVKQWVAEQKRADEAAAAFRTLMDTPADPERRDAPKRDELREYFAGRAGKNFELRAENVVDFRALSKLTAAAGLNTVKTSFYERLMAHLIEVSGILMAGPMVLNTTTGEPIQVPITTAHSTGALVAEAGTIPTSEPVFGQRALGSYKYGDLMQASNELLNDTSVDLEGYLAMQAGRAVGNALGVHLITGTGTNQPSGVVTTATLGVTGAAAVVGAPNADNLIDLFYSVIAPYRNSPSCSWLMRDATLGTVRKFKDSTGQYLWQPSIQVGAPDTLLGKPVYTDPNVPAVALSAKSVLFGDISQYFVRLVNAIRFERSDDFAFNTDLVTFRCLIRADGMLVDQTGAVKFYQGNAS